MLITVLGTLLFIVIAIQHDLTHNTFIHNNLFFEPWSLIFESGHSPRLQFFYCLISSQFLCLSLRFVSLFLWVLTFVCFAPFFDASYCSPTLPPKAGVDFIKQFTPYTKRKITILGFQLAFCAQLSFIKYFLSMYALHPSPLCYP
jgi:hypothetical protein